MDLVYDTSDANCLPTNPRWYYQEAQKLYPRPESLCSPQKSLLEGIAPAVLFNCSNDLLTSDGGGHWIFDCKAKTGIKNAIHFNRGPATYEGRLKWESWSTGLEDHDYCLFLKPDPWVAGQYPGLTTGNDPNDGIGLEFLDSEVINVLRTPWWVRFRDAVICDYPHFADGCDSRPHSAHISEILGFEPRCIATGLLGLDCQHACHTELHPLYALAMNVPWTPAPPDSAEASREHWVFFVRNAGTEGDCGEHTHRLVAANPGQEGYNLRLPAPNQQIVSATLHTDSYILGYGYGIALTSVIFVKGQGLYFTFSFPRQDANDVLIEGDLDIEWATDKARIRPTAGESSRIESRIFARHQLSIFDRMPYLYERATEAEKKKVRQRFLENLSASLGTTLPPIDPMELDDLILVVSAKRAGIVHQPEETFEPTGIPIPPIAVDDRQPLVVLGLVDRVDEAARVPAADQLVREALTEDKARFKNILSRWAQPMKIPQ
jgi:hypothetical protein